MGSGGLRLQASVWAALGAKPSRLDLLKPGNIICCVPPEEQFQQDQLQGGCLAYSLFKVKDVKQEISGALLFRERERRIGGIKWKLENIHEISPKSLPIPSIS